MRDKIFICIMFTILFVIPVGILCRNEKNISIAENRTLFKKSDVKLSSINKDIDSLFEDQFIFGERLKEKYNICKNKVIAISMKFIEKNKLMELIPMGKNLYRIANTDYYVHGTKDIGMNVDQYQYSIKRMNELCEKYSNIKFYLYNHVTDETIVNQQKYNDFFYQELDDKIEFKHSQFINSYDEYQKYFYKTDHHWNKDGSYKGYLEIAELLGIDNKIGIRDTVKLDNIKFYGSKARELGNYDVYDEFEVNLFDYPNMEIEINYNQVKDYGKSSLYLENKVDVKDKEINHYGEFYGWDDGIIKFSVNENLDKDNILIFANSYSNPINKLIASGFKETYVVDLRNYEGQIGYKFSIDKFIEEHDIDKILVIGNNNFFTNKGNYIE